MTAHPRFAPFNFQDWIERNKGNLKPPVSNKQLFDEKTGMVVMIVGGPNKRVDFHDDPVEEFFYQLKGNMVLKVCDRGEFYDVPIREGDIFMLPPHVRHSPQRPQVGSIGLVVENKRPAGANDAFEWYCFECGTLVHRVEVALNSIVKDLPPLFEAFYSDEKSRTCPNCGVVHPGKFPPPGWVKVD